MTEGELQRAVMDLCEQQEPRVRVVHLHDSRQATADTKGLPDLLLLGTHRLIWRELKGPGGQPRRQQSQWLHWLTQTGQDAAVWRPADWHTGRIATELAALNLPPGQHSERPDAASPDPEAAFFHALYGPRK